MIYLELFKTFFLIGMFSFGGGMANMELIRSRVVTDHGWLTNTEFTDIISISEMTPGPLGINIASFVGTRTAGIPGTVSATFAYVLPSLVIVLIMARIYYKYRNLDTVKGVLNGLHPAVAAMVFAAAMKLVGNAWWGGIELADFANTDWIAVALALVFLILLQKKKLGPVQSILLSGICGAVLPKETLFDLYKAKHFYCPACGTVTENTANFCPQCGERLRHR